MEITANISPTIALVGILSGIFLFSLSLLVFHILLQRRKAKARSMPHGGGAAATHAPHNNNHHHHQQQQQALSWSSFSFSSRRRHHHHHSRSRPRSDSESDIASVDGAEGEEKGRKMMNDRGGSPRASSLYLEPNQPLYVDVDVDVESESDDRGPHPGMQFILTPPTPGR